MIKVSIQNGWYEANKIIKDYKNGESFLKSGGANFNEYLPPKIIAVYFLFLDQDIYEGELIKTNNGKLSMLLFKTFFYYLSLYFLSLIIAKNFSVRLSFYTILFLSLMPDIMQYHSSFWNETYFFPFQIMTIYFVLKQSNKARDNILLGIVVAAMYLVSQEYLLYFLVLIIYLIIKFKKNYLPIFYFFISFAIVLASVNIFLNQIDNSNSSNFGIKSAYYLYFAPEIIAKKNDISVKSSNQILKDKALNWAKKNQLTAVDSGNLLLNFENPSENKKYLNFIFKESLRIILSNPIIVLQSIIKSTFHLGTLNPFYINFFYEYSGKGEYLKTDTHKNLISVRIIYSIIIYTIVVFGFYKSTKNINNPLIIYFVLSILYVILAMGWMGHSRYFIPSLIFMSFFFGNFFEEKYLKHR